MSESCQHGRRKDTCPYCMITRREREIAALRARVEELEADKVRLDWLGHQPGVALINDDDGYWAVSGDGFQNVRVNNQGPLETSFYVEQEQFRDSVRAAIDAAIAQSAPP